MTTKPASQQLDFGQLAVIADEIEAGTNLKVGGNTISATEIGYTDGVTAGTATASKAVVLGSSKEISVITTAGITNVDVGASGTAGSLDVFPATASKGKLAVSVTDQTGDTTVSLVVDAMAAARTITLRDPGAAASILTTTDTTAAATTSTAAELSKLDDSVISTTLVRGAGVDTAEAYGAGYLRLGSLIHTKIVLDLTGMVGSATDLDVIGESAAASCHWGQITAANGTLTGGQITCLEVPAGGADDIDFYSSTVSTGTQDVIITDAALGTETALVTSGGAWTAGLTKVMTGLPTANDYLYVVNGEAVGGTFTAGKFLIEFFGTA